LQLPVLVHNITKPVVDLEGNKQYQEHHRKGVAPIEELRSFIRDIFLIVPITANWISGVGVFAS